MKGEGSQLHAPFWGARLAALVDRLADGDAPPAMRLAALHEHLSVGAGAPDEQGVCQPGAGAAEAAVHLLSQQAQWEALVALSSPQPQGERDALLLAALQAASQRPPQQPRQPQQQVPAGLAPDAEQLAAMQGFQQQSRQLVHALLAEYRARVAAGARRLHQPASPTAKPPEPVQVQQQQQAQAQALLASCGAQEHAAHTYLQWQAALAPVLAGAGAGSERDGALPPWSAALPCASFGAGEQRSGGAASWGGGGSSGMQATAGEQRSGKAAPRRRASSHAHKKLQLEASVAALVQQLAGLRRANAALRAREAALDALLQQRDGQVFALLAHKAAAALEGRQDKPLAPVPRAILAPVAEPLPRSAWKQAWLPNMHGPAPTPGAMPLFQPLPQTYVATFAKIYSGFVTDAKLLLAAKAGSPHEGTIDAYLTSRGAFVLSTIRRYNLLNPTLLYQLRALDMSSLRPGLPPDGHWRRVARVMRGLLAEAELQQLKLHVRLFRASLRANRKEQGAALQQLAATGRRLAALSGGAEPAGSCAGASAGAGSSASSDDGGSSSAGSERCLSLAATPQQLSLSLQLDEQLRALEALLLREHDLHFGLLWSATSVPASVLAIVEVFCASWPFAANFHAILPHLADGA